MTQKPESTTSSTACQDVSRNKLETSAASVDVSVMRSDPFGGDDPL